MEKVTQRVGQMGEASNFYEPQLFWLSLYRSKILLNLALLGRDEDWFFRKRQQVKTPETFVSTGLLKSLLADPSTASQHVLTQSFVNEDDWESELAICQDILQSEKEKSDAWSNEGKPKL